MRKWIEFSEGLKSGEATNDETPPPPAASAEDMIKEAVISIKSKKLLNGYASYLCEQPSLRAWALLAKEDPLAWP